MTPSLIIGQERVFMPRILMTTEKVLCALGEGLCIHPPAPVRPVMPLTAEQTDRMPKEHHRLSLTPSKEPVLWWDRVW